MFAEPGGSAVWLEFQIDVAHVVLQLQLFSTRRLEAPPGGRGGGGGGGRSKLSGFVGSRTGDAIAAVLRDSPPLKEDG